MASLSFQSNARKYRPSRFDEIVGQDVAVTILKNALRFNRIASAYLFCGNRGTGKTTLARILAKALNCDHLTKELEPCNHCPSCIEISSGSSLNVLEIDGASNRGIDDIRQINETVGYAPTTGIYKIYLIDEVHMLTKEAFNALLKTLEEPPAHVKFFFATTEPDKVLATILSRCQRFDLYRLSEDVILQKLSKICEKEKIDVEKEALSLIAKQAEGSLRDAESHLDRLFCYADPPLKLEHAEKLLGIIPKQLFLSLDRAIEKTELSFAFELTGHLQNIGKDLRHLIEDLMEHFHRHLSIKLSLEISHDQDDLKINSIYTLDQCLYILDFLFHCLQTLSSSHRVALEAILLHLIRSKNCLPIDALIQRLTVLEANLLSLQQSDPLPEKKETIISLSENLQTVSIPDAEKPFPDISRTPSASPPPSKPTLAQKAKYETLIRFAAVEWEGTVKN